MPTPKLKIHFIGIGGIGVSALAQYYLAKGHVVSGSDLVASEITEVLKRKGVKLTRNDLVNLDLVVYSPAVPESDSELKKARKLGIRCLSYPQALGELTKQHFTIAVSGTHGKSTTCAMMGLILTKAGFDPTVIVGTKVKEFADLNCRVGKSKFLVIEADEHFASFLNYWPKIIVLTNIEKDHLDFYKSLKNILKTFKEYISHLPKDGILIANKDDQNVRGLASNSVLYSLRQKEAKKLRKILKVPGEHNVYNALAALTVARALKIPDKISYKTLSEYRGSWRRFEIKRGAPTIVSDYAHHPTEIKATLKAAREKWPKKKIWCIFQPHQYQRTFYLFNDFIKSFDRADEIILCDIYDVVGREEKQISKKVNSKKLAEAIRLRGKIAHYLGDFRKIPQFLKNKVRPDDIILIMGAGNIYKLTDAFPQEGIDKN